MTMPSWAQMFPGQGEPISGQSEDYRRAATVAASLERTTTLVSDEFARVRRSSELGELSGQAANQLVTLIKEVNDKLDHVPPFFNQLDRIFDDHATRLRELERKTADALARGNARWNEIEVAEQDEQTARSALTSIESQIRQLDWSADDPEIVEVRRSDLERIRSSRQWTLQTRVSATATARQRLADIGEERRQLEVAERALVERTAEKLRHLDVGELADPNVVAEWIRNRFEDVADFVTEYVQDFINAYKALLSGDFMDALWYLSDCLEAILTIVSAIALVVAVFFTGGTILAVIGLALAATKFAVDTALFSTQHPHPETGETKSALDLAIDGALLLISAVTLGAASHGDKFLKLSGGHKRSMAGNVRQLLKPVSHAGKPLYGAARTSTTIRSATELGASTIDMVIDEGKDRIVGEVRELADAPLTTDGDAWVKTGFVDFAQRSPNADRSIRAVEAQTASIGHLQSSGPTLDAASAQYQLVAA